LTIALAVFPRCEHLGPAGAAQEAPKTIKIGAVVPLTGAMAAGGRWVKQGYEIGLKHVKKTAGSLFKQFGRRSLLSRFLDDESAPTKTASRMEKLYSVDKVDLFLGGFANALIIPQLAIAEKYRVPSFVTTIGSTRSLKRATNTAFRPSWLSRIR